MLITLLVICTHGLLVCFAAPEEYNWDVLLMAENNSDLVAKGQRKCMDSLNEDMSLIMNIAWTQFKEEFKREFNDSQEHDRRKNLFCETFLMIREHNKAHEEGLASYNMGINPFSDKTEEDMNGLRGSRFNESMALKDGIPYEHLGVQILISVNCRDKGAVTPIRFQGECSSCWAFAAAATIEGHECIASGTLYTLSPQQMVDCSACNGCYGGDAMIAYKYVKENGGLTEERSYPYVSTHDKYPKRCNFKPYMAVSHVRGYVQLLKNDEDELAEAVALHGPVAVSIFTRIASLRNYRSGIYSDRNCRNTLYDIDHAVVVVGYGTERGQPYWLIKNSWSTQWGDEGYLKLARNSNNMCAIATYPAYPLISR